MRKMDSLGLRLCSYQAELFERSLSGTECSSKIFVRRFMNSDLARRMDSIGFLFDSLDVSDALAELDAQYGPSSYGNEKFSNEEMHWVGYIYRYWAYTYELSSKQLYKKKKPDELRKLYFPYHSLDPLQAIERILEGTGPEESADDIARGVIILRNVRQKRALQSDPVQGFEDRATPAAAVFAAQREEYKA